MQYISPPTFLLSRAPQLGVEGTEVVSSRIFVLLISFSLRLYRLRVTTALTLLRCLEICRSVICAQRVTDAQSAYAVEDVWKWVDVLVGSRQLLRDDDDDAIDQFPLCTYLFSAARL